MEPTKEESYYIDSPEKFKKLIVRAVTELDGLSNNSKPGFTLESAEKVVDVVFEKFCMISQFGSSASFLDKDSVCSLVKKSALPEEDVYRAQSHLVSLSRLIEDKCQNITEIAKEEINFCKNLFSGILKSINPETAKVN